MVTQQDIQRVKGEIADLQQKIAALRARKAGVATMDNIRRMAEEDRQTAIQPMQRVPASQFPMAEPQGYKAVQNITGGYEAKDVPLGQKFPSVLGSTQTLPQTLGIDKALEPEKVKDWSSLGRNAARAIAGFGIGTVELPRKLLSPSLQDKIDALHEIESMLPNIRGDVRQSLGEVLGPIYDAVAYPLGDKEAGERLSQSGGLAPAASAAMIAAPIGAKRAVPFKNIEAIVKEARNVQRPAVAPQPVTRGIPKNGLEVEAQLGEAARLADESTARLDRVDQGQKNLTKTPNDMYSEFDPEPHNQRFGLDIRSGAEHAAAIPGEPVEWIGRSPNDSPAVLFEAEEGGGWIIERRDESYVYNPITKNSVFDSPEDAWREYVNQNRQSSSQPPFKAKVTGMGAKKLLEKPAFPVQESKPIQEIPPSGEAVKPQPPAAAREVAATAPPKPPVETPKPVAETPEPQGKFVSLKKSEGAEIRKRMRLDELDPVERKTFEDSWDNVVKSGKAEDALNIARDVIEHGRQNKVMDDHTALLQKSIEIERSMDEAGRNLSEAAKRGDDATVTSEMARILNLNEEMDLVTRASDMMGTEAGRGLSVRRMRADKESLSLAHVLQTARTNKGRALSAPEVAEFESSVKRIKDLEAENTSLAETSSRLAAERDRAVAERVTRAERQRVADPLKKAALRDKLAAERANLEKQLAAMGNQMNAVVGPPTEAMHLMGKLAANYIKEGAASLDDVVASIKKKFPNVTDRDVWEALQARSPEAQMAAKKVVEKNLSEFKKQARLLTEIDNLEKGITEKPTSPLSKAQETARTKELRKRLSELRKSLYQSESLPADRLEAAITTLNQLQDHLANKTRPLKKGAPEIPAEVKPIKDQIAALRRQMKSEDVLADLNEQLKTGEFKVTAKKEPFVTPELERNQILINQARRKLREQLDAKKPMTAGRRAGAVVSGLREVAATADVSGTLRQGLVLTARRLLSDPVGLAKRNADAWKSMLNKYKDEQIHNALKNDPQYADAVGDGLRLAEKGGEELYHSPLVEKIPGFGKVAQMSERHMRTYLNVMRWDAYKKFREAAPNATKAERAAIARSLNVMSGYGDLRSAPQALAVASKVFFAPRFAVSRFQTPKLILDYWKEPRVRKEIAKNYAATAAFGASILAMAKMMGGEVGDDPRSADFGKVRFGDSRFDLWGGFQQPMRLMFRLGMIGTDRLGVTGQDLKDREKDTDPFDLVSQFAVYKLAPHITLPVELVRGKTVIGEKTTPLETLARTVVPFMVRDIKEAYAQQGIGLAVATGLVSAFGGGVGTYPDSETATRIKARRLIAENKTTEAQAMLAAWNKSNPKNRITTP